jgi:Transposase
MRRPSGGQHRRRHARLDYLWRRWAEGCVRGRHLLGEIRLRGYTGSLSNLQWLLAQWRRAGESKRSPPTAVDRRVETSPTVAAPAIDPPTGWSITPIVAAALCIKPRGALTKKQAVKVNVLKSGWPDFTIMRQLAMRFRGLLRSGDLERFGAWLDDTQHSGIYGTQRFARMVRRDLDAVRNALTEEWSNGQTEGQINRLKTLKRVMYGRAGPELLRARMLPLQSCTQHGN